MVLHRLAWRGTAAPNGTLLTAKGVLRGLASRLAISARAGDTPPGRPHGGALDFGSSRMGGRDATRRTEAMYPCTTRGSTRRLAISLRHVSRALLGRDGWGGLAACLVSRGGHDRHRDAAGRGCVAA